MQRAGTSQDIHTLAPLLWRRESTRSDIYPEFKSPTSFSAAGASCRFRRVGAVINRSDGEE